MKILFLEIEIFPGIFLLLLAFPPCKAEQPLQKMKSQEKEQENEEKCKGEMITQNPNIKRAC